MFDNFVVLVGFLGVLYAALAKFIQNKLVDRTEMEAFQAESKKLSGEYDKAKKAGNTKKMDEIMQQQMEFLPKMNGMMFKQFKPMIVILAIFFACTWIFGMVDPYVKDDIHLNITDDGKGCDKIAGDGIYTDCFNLTNQNYGKWTINAKAYETNTVRSTNEIYFIYKESDDNYTEKATGEVMNITTEKMSYSDNETVKVTIIPPINADHVQLTISNGTYFRVDLPFTIPILDIKRIYQPYWWFIFTSLITNVIASIAIGQMDKAKKKESTEVSNAL